MWAIEEFANCNSNYEITNPTWAFVLQWMPFLNQTPDVYISGGNNPSLQSTTKTPMATANLLWTPSLSTMIAPRPTIQQLSFGQPPSHFTAGGSTAAEFFAFSLAHPVADQICRGERNGGFLTRREKIPERRAPFSYTPPTSSFTLPSLRLSSRHAAMPITPVLKVMCPLAAKEGSTVAVAQAADDTQVAKRNINESTRRSSGKLSRKTIYTVMVGASFCAVVAVFSIVIVKQQALDFLVIPEISFRSIKKFLNVMLELASGWINIWFSFYYLNGLQNLGKRGKSKPSKKQCIRFNDVEGVDAAKAELLDIVLCIKGDSRYMKLGAKIPRGVLLAGPTGTGKTLLARAVAGEADVAFFSISASEFDQIFAGSGAACVRDLFRDARKRSPSIIFIDEIDAVGGQRGRCLNSERDQTLNQLLTEMDGFEECGNVVVIAATNRPELLDSALMRPGRFSRKVYVGEPDEDGRRKIFRLYLKEVKMEEDKEVICDLVASLTPGLVGADLANIANESVMLAARRGGDFVTKEDVLQAVERAITKICNDR